MCLFLFLLKHGEEVIGVRVEEDLKNLEKKSHEKPVWVFLKLLRKAGGVYWAIDMQKLYVYW